MVRNCWDCGQCQARQRGSDISTRTGCDKEKGNQKEKGKDLLGKGKGLLDCTIEELLRSLLDYLQIIIRNLSSILKF